MSLPFIANLKTNKNGNNNNTHSSNVRRLVRGFLRNLSHD